MITTGKKNISIVAPCCNEQEMIPAFLDHIASVAAKMQDYLFEFVLVDDGSTDNTPALLDEAAADPRVKIVHLSRNFGHQRAIAAGLDFCDGDIAVVIDADLQDPPEIIPAMIAALEAGADVAHAVRSDRRSDSIWKRLSAKLFYQVMRRFVLPELPEDSGDFKAFTRPVLLALREYGERVRFTRGMIATIGFRQVEVPYVRHARMAGKTKFSPLRIMRFARDAVVSYTVLPLRIGVFAGSAAFMTAFSYAIVCCGVVCVGGVLEEPMLHLIAILLLGIGGLILVLLGIAGEYLHCIVMEVKKRPMYIVASTRNIAARKEEGVPAHADNV